MGKGRLRVLCQARVARLCAAIVLLGLLLGMPGRAEAQAVKGSIVSVGIGGNAGRDGVYREGSWVPVQVQIKNMTPGPFAGRLGVTQLDLDGDKALSLGPAFVLQPGVEERTLWTYYWPRTDETSVPGGIKEIAVYDKNGPVAKLSIPNSAGDASGGAVAIMPDDDSFQHMETVKRSTRFVVVLGDSFAGWKSFEGMWGGTEAVKPVLVKANQLPDDVKGLDGVDLIVWEADQVKVSDVPADFQLKAMLEWVKAGGHLMISVGTQGQEFAKAPAALQEAMPLAVTGATREVKASDLRGNNGDTTWNYSQPLGTPAEKAVVQALGDLKPGSRPVAGLFNGAFADHPIAVTGIYGRGAVTVVTFNVANPDFRLPEEQAIEFWNQTAGWQSGRFLTADGFKKNAALPENDGARITTSAREIQIGKSIPTAIDVSDVTMVRILVALLFLAIYWLVAGPVGYLILRQYKVVHWSWWIFGGVVLAATAVAGTVVLVLHVNAYDVRHRSFVLGTVNSPDVTVSSYYGVYAPVSGPVKISQPRSAGGMNYLAPLCFPTLAEVKSYADPRSYDIDVDAGADADEVAVLPIFRNTLKKMQGRWTGQMGKVEGTAEFVSESTDLRHLLKGKLTNNSGYNLEDADVVVYLPRATPAFARGDSYLFHINMPGHSWNPGDKRTWKQGEMIALENLELDALEGDKTHPGTVEQALSAAGWDNTEKETIPSHIGNWIDDSDDVIVRLRDKRAWPEDLLFVLLDDRKIDSLTNTRRCEPVRGVGRLTDCTKLLKAACGLIVAHAGDGNNGVKSPVPLKVNDKEVAGKGQILFAWALPVSGKVPPATLMSDASATQGAKPAAATRGSVLPGPEVP